MGPKYKIDYSKRKSSCQQCNRKIEIRRLRIGEKDKASHGHFQWSFQHVKCFFSFRNPILKNFLKHHNNSAANIYNFENLEHFHREAIQEIMENGYITDELEQNGIIETLERPMTNLLDFKIKQIKTDVECQTCKDVIKKKEMCVVYKPEKEVLHLQCFKMEKENMGYYKDVKYISGFDNLSEDYKCQIKSPTKRPSEDQTEGALKKPRTSLDVNKVENKPKNLKEQTLRIDELKDILGKYERKHLHAILSLNNQETPSHQSECVKRLADAFAFGTLEKCPECPSGQLVPDKYDYECTGYYNEDAKCQYRTREPYRSLTVIPEGEIYDPLRIMKHQVGVRLFHDKASETEHCGAPLSNVDDLSCAVPATARDVNGMQPPSPQPGPSTGEISDSGYWTPKLKFIDRHLVKGRGVVHPLSCLTSEAHVYEDSEGNVYSAVLLKIDVQEGLNLCYYLQLLEINDGKGYYVFRAWGSVGIVQNSMKEYFTHLKKAMNHFVKLFKAKTQQDWNYRDSNDKKAGYYRMSELDYGDHFEEAPGMTPDLSDPVQHLVATICNINAMKITMCEYEIDAELMPVGRLAASQIKAGYDVLTQLLSHFESGAETENEIVAHSNRFFELIPHNYGNNGPPRLDNKKIIEDKISMLEQLRNLQCSYRVLQSGDRLVESVNEKYKKLKTVIEVVPKRSPVFKLIQRYAANSHSPNHDEYSISVQQVFSVRRAGEAQRFERFRGLHRRLLWHGSFTTSFAGILAEGMQIFDEPANGALFGKGLYFADMVSKSANYCGRTPENNYPVSGILMLCDVALGEMRRCLVDYKQRIKQQWLDNKDGTNSVWGVGQLSLEPSQYKLLDGALVPLGLPVKTDYDTDLLHNEYVVPDVDQVNIKYLVCFNFIWNK